MSLNLKLIKLSGATMNSKYSNRISNYNMDTKSPLPNLSQWLGDSYAVIRKEIKKLEDV